MIITKEIINGRAATVIKDVGKMSLSDTLECGQAFRYERLPETSGITRYMTVAYDRLIFVGQRERGEIILFSEDESLLREVVIPYFSLDTDYTAIRDEIISLTDSEWLKDAARLADGIVILRQDAWETLFSFIISQNNNIPRIRKIIRRLSVEYGENLAAREGLATCPLGKCEGVDSEVCRACGACFSFPRANDVLSCPEKMLSANPGFRYRYLLSAAEAVTSGEVDLDRIKAAASYDYTVAELKKICGVGDKVAACTALFGFGNLEAFPIDVWMKRAIDKYFGGKLDHTSLGRYAGIAQQYIFHKMRNIEEGKTNG
ncbi:MAG: DNA-3-methyladenine glycosylase 2 family protein [Clostridia bacterium]|nr:DNA-3-methyladenine glycosylase 2 family protein [Clostridia bacterium]